MITLIVPDYCQSCTDFEPQVTQRPMQKDMLTDLILAMATLFFVAIHM